MAEAPTLMLTPEQLTTLRAVFNCLSDEGKEQVMAMYAGSLSAIAEVCGSPVSPYNSILTELATLAHDYPRKEVKSG